MRKILVILMIIAGLAYLSQNETIKNNYSRKHWDGFLVLLAVFMILLVGLRTYYNDTLNYIVGFMNSDDIFEFFSDPKNLDIMNNPLFYGFQALIRTKTHNYTVFFMICATIVNVLFLRFIKRNADREDFVYSMFLYVCLGTLMLSMAAQKQILTMAVLTLAIEALFDKKYVKYYIVVFLAGLIHTYAWLFLFLPLLGDKPWNLRTTLLLLLTVTIMQSFQSSIASFIEVADSVGKNVAVEEVFDGNQMNVLRVGVYAVVPFTALIFRSRLKNVMDRKHGILIQMSTVSFLFMLLGTMNGANMFGRSANYFEISLILILPWMIRQLFTKQSAKLVFMVAMVCFVGFYIYDCQDFGSSYYYKSLWQFIGEIL